MDRLESDSSVIEKMSDQESCTEDGFAQIEGLISGYPKRGPRAGNNRYLQLCLRVTAIAALVGSYVGVFFAGRYSWSIKELDRMSINRASTYSPVLKLMDPTPKMTQFNGSLGYKSEYSGDPSPEVDAAWYRWSHIRYTSIPDDEFAKLPGAAEDFKDSARLTPDLGGGYLGFVEFNHQMHCLNLLRQGLHRDYYDRPENADWRPLAFTDRPETIKLHMQHCIEALRQNIMCNADVGVVPSVWLAGNPYPYANFNTFHKCRDIETVERWIEENEIDHKSGTKFDVPADATLIETPP